MRISYVVCAVILLASVSPAAAQWTPLDPITTVTKEADDVRAIFRSGGVLKLQVCSPSIIHFIYSPTGNFPARHDEVVIKNSWPPAQFVETPEQGKVTLGTSALRIVTESETGAITFFSASGQQLFRDAKRIMTPETINGEKTFRGETVVEMYGSHEGFYGLGQHQAGVWNYRGESVDLSQENTNIAVPLLLSSNGYGIFWNNTSRTRVNNRFVHALYISSEVADSIDYYFIYGPEFDKIIAGYREMTGAAPMFGRWAYGFWQCKNRYKSQQEILGVAKKYRDLHLPADNIVQDWFWWNRKGEHVFNKNYPDPKAMVDQLHDEHFHLMISVWPFFEPGSKEYDEMDRRGFFIDRTKVAKPPYHAGGMAVYDPTNPEARRYYWQLMDKALFKIGVDAWWLDTTEPETEGQEENILLGHKLAIGSGDRYANIFPLETTRAVYEGQRSASDQKRVFILSRSAFAGSQRYGVTAWSGDVLSDWLSFKRQIPAGLNFSLSGNPYWTTDIGGFISGGDLSDPKFRELFVRWLQFGTFSPIFRVHGTRYNPDENELWSYGPESKILVQYDNLRYRLLPYIYSLAWKTTSESYTPMRPLVMDFRNDLNAQNIGDQFMYGPAFLVNPVTEQAAAQRHVYLPNGKWYDFWTGSTLEGGKFADVAAPLDRMPLYVRAGSIIPMGPEQEYSNQKPADPIELRVYSGADGDFTLYEDEGDTYNYEKGRYATIPIHWKDATHTLTVGERKGSFSGMLQSRTFNVTFTREKRGTGIEPAPAPDKVIQYSGREVSTTAE
ncbi:MAG TPA: glycoside hydrolase family 31 protein [Terriglobales bacterium]|nr:glycoside hydrolase family 31 protein [Terriglobales bacterium]